MCVVGEHVFNFRLDTLFIVWYTTVGPSPDPDIGLLRMELR